MKFGFFDGREDGVGIVEISKMFAMPGTFSFGTATFNEVYMRMIVRTDKAPYHHYLI